MCAGACRRNLSAVGSFWVPRGAGANGSDSVTKTLCAEACGAEGHDQVEMIETMSCFSMVHYAANMPSTLSPSRRALVSGLAFSTGDGRLKRK